MKKEYDFSKGERGKFYQRGIELNVPVYLEPDVAEVVRRRARKTDSSMEAVVNDWLRQDIGASCRIHRQSCRRAGRQSAEAAHEVLNLQVSSRRVDVQWMRQVMRAYKQIIR